MKKKPGFALRSVCGEKFLIAEGVDNIDFSKLIALNESSVYLWKSLADGEEFTEETLVELLMNEYEVSREQASEDVAVLCRSMIEAEIVEP